MPLIEYVCSERHDDDAIAAQEGPSITLHHAKWALCPRGGIEKHVWSAIEPTDAEVLKISRTVVRETRHHAVG